MKKVTVIVVLAIVVIALASSGWVYSIVRSNRADELESVQRSFVQQYGSVATINELVSPKKVYAASWTADGNNNISWNIGGIWVLVYSVPVAATDTQEESK
jgi:type II secretory pathway pseudopilin PulG